VRVDWGVEARERDAKVVGTFTLGAVDKAEVGKSEGVDARRDCGV
jgi:hypothetical protein